MSVQIEPEVPQLPAAAKEVVRVWTPRAVSVYGVLLGFPGGLAVAVRNWKALRMPREVRLHLLIGVATCLVLTPVLLLLPTKLNRGLGIGLTVGTYMYLRTKFTTDVATAQLTYDVQYRPWYSALGWALLGLFSFLVVVMVAGMTLTALGVNIPD